MGGGAATGVGGFVCALLLLLLSLMGAMCGGGADQAKIACAPGQAALGRGFVSSTSMSLAASDCGVAGSCQDADNVATGFLSADCIVWYSSRQLVPRACASAL
eukprot:5289678-Amphidinium_carterae.2